jgi:CHASE2 domain-containing sensor protein
MDYKIKNIYYKYFKHKDVWSIIIVSSLLTILVAAIFTVSTNITSLSAYLSTSHSEDGRFEDLYAQSMNWGSSVLSDNITIISLDGLERSSFGNLVDTLTKMNPKVICIDVIFNTYDEADSALINAINKTKIPIVLAAHAIQDKNSGKYIRVEGSYFINKINKNNNFSIGLDNLGASSSPSDVIRNFVPKCKMEDGKVYESFALSAAKRLDKSKCFNQINNCYESKKIHYHNMDFHELSNREVLNRECIDSITEMIKGKIAFLGFTDDNRDEHITPIEENMPGIRIHASATETILQGNYIKTSSPWINSFIVVLIIVFFNFVLYWTKKMYVRAGKLLVRLTQIFLIVFFFYIGAIAYFYMNVYIDLSILISSMALSMVCFDIVYGMYGLILFVKRKFFTK